MILGEQDLRLMELEEVNRKLAAECLRLEETIQSTVPNVDKMNDMLVNQGLASQYDDVHSQRSYNMMFEEPIS